MAHENKLRIVMISAEAVPYAKVGGLADVVGALPQVLEKQGASLTVVVPGYKTIDHTRHGIHACDTVPSLDVPMGSGSIRAEIYQTRMKGTSIDLFFIGCAKYFDRDGIYDDPVSREGFPDNMERFVFFMKAGLELIERLARPVDVIHCHDSQTALIPGLLRTELQHRPFFAGVGTLFTIHNLAYQGVYPPEALYWAGIDSGWFYPASPFEFWGKVNFMKVGIEFADRVNTVSETYAREIQTSPEYGYGLEGVLKRRSQVLSGIVNGIDYAQWNPETDPLIPYHYSAGDLSGKAACKSELLKSFNLPRSRKRTPLIGVVSRLADQKGFDLMAEAMEELAGLDLQMVVLGTGQQRYHDLFLQFASRHPDKIGIKLGFDNPLAHQIEAGCDMFLMPSKYEPCGLNQLYSLRYGTIPIVRATGGLADTVTDYGRRTEGNGGTGFSFENYSSREMMDAIRRALAVYASGSEWQVLVRRSMAQDWSWDQSARKYMQLYQEIAREKRADR